MPEHRNQVYGASQRAPIRLSLTATELAIEVVSADGSPLGRPFLVSLECNGDLIGWPITLAPYGRAVEGGRFGRAEATTVLLRAADALLRSISTTDRDGPGEPPDCQELLA